MRKQDTIDQFPIHTAQEVIVWAVLLTMTSLEQGDRRS